MQIFIRASLIFVTLIFDQSYLLDWSATVNFERFHN